MKFYRIEIQCVDGVYASNYIVVALVWQPEDKVCSYIYAEGLGAGYSIDGLSKGVATVYMLECGVVDALDAVLYGNVMSLS